jgi:hypothetical protein
MTRLATILATILLLLVEGSAHANPIFMIREGINEDIQFLGMADTDSEKLDFLPIPPEVRGASYKIFKGCMICPDSTSYSTDDPGADRFTLRVVPGTGDVFLEGFTSPGEDASLLQVDEQVSIPIFGFGHMRRVLNQAAHAAARSKGTHFRRLLPRLVISPLSGPSHIAYAAWSGRFFLRESAT